MDREEIISMALAAGIFHEYDSEGHWDGLTNEALIGKDWLSSKEHKLDRIVEILSPFAVLVAAAEREKVAAWMMRQGYATGHGDTIEDLLKELEWQIAEREREACAKVCEILGAEDDSFYAEFSRAKDCAAAIRART
jgi:hypothetical protein